MPPFATTLLLLLLLFATTTPTFALNLYIDSFTCQNDLSIRAKSFEMICENQEDGSSSSCPFGDSVTLEGQFEYEGVADAGVQNSVYVSLCHENVYFVNELQYDNNEEEEEEEEDGEEEGDEEGEEGDERRALRRRLDEEGQEGEEEGQEGEEEEQQEEGEEDKEEEEDDKEEEEEEQQGEQEDQDGEQYCPGDGLYSWSMSYTLPENNGSWLATGWKGKGVVNMYATEDDEDSLVGSCTITLGTRATRSSGEGFSMPSASTTVGILGAVILVLALCCCACCFCVAKRRQRRRLGGKGDAKTAHLTQHDYGQDESDATSTIETRRDDGGSEVKLY